MKPFAKARSPANLARTIKRLEIVAFGKDFASITVAFEREIDGQVTRGRQSQTWVRLPEGWRIVFAHVSMLALTPLFWCRSYWLTSKRIFAWLRHRLWAILL